MVKVNENPGATTNAPNAPATTNPTPPTTKAAPAQELPWYERAWNWLSGAGGATPKHMVENARAYTPLSVKNSGPRGNAPKQVAVKPDAYGTVAKSRSQTLGDTYGTTSEAVRLHHLMNTYRMNGAPLPPTLQARIQNNPELAQQANAYGKALKQGPPKPAALAAPVAPSAPAAPAAPSAPVVTEPQQKKLGALAWKQRSPFMNSRYKVQEKQVSQPMVSALGTPDAGTVYQKQSLGQLATQRRPVAQNLGMTKVDRATRPFGTRGRTPIGHGAFGGGPISALWRKGRL